MNEKTRLNVFAYSSVSIHCRRRRCRCFSSLARVKVSDRKDACLLEKPFLLFAFLYWNNYLFASVRFTYLPTLLRINSFYQMARRSQIWENERTPSIETRVRFWKKRKLFVSGKRRYVDAKRKCFRKYFILFLFGLMSNSFPLAVIFCLRLYLFRF